MKPPRGLLVGDRAGRLEWDRIVGALEARRLPLPSARWLAAYCARASWLWKLQRQARRARRRGDVRAARPLAGEVRQWLDSLAAMRDQRTPAVRRILLGLSADKGGAA